MRDWAQGMAWMQAAAMDLDLEGRDDDYDPDTGLSEYYAAMDLDLEGRDDNLDTANPTPAAIAPQWISTWRVETIRAMGVRVAGLG